MAQLQGLCGQLASSGAIEEEVAADADRAHETAHARAAGPHTHGLSQGLACRVAAVVKTTAGLLVHHTGVSSSKGACCGYPNGTLVWPNEQKEWCSA